MGVLGQLAIFFQQLRRIAARTAIDAVGLQSAATATIATLRPVIVTTPATTVVIPTIIIQGRVFLNSGPPLGKFAGRRIALSFRCSPAAEPSTQYLPWLSGN
jgi:hypothetical protein